MTAFHGYNPRFAQFIRRSRSSLQASRLLSSFSEIFPKKLIGIACQGMYLLEYRCIPTYSELERNDVPLRQHRTRTRLITVEQRELQNG
ncbi:hypothetical protein BN2476_470017 [Paraburkholderia piptadeniae]|uniref:Uncharacterized protein n=1 Tax=Paraburkholderia piptadeniae TaxID=1701573 RepID=A0A1N7SEX0_9BURK|nr:hypothetical protein BN2476_470017 [Paraburkholderia piptadeniae]